MRPFIAAVAVVIAACGDGSAATAPSSDTATATTRDTTAATTSPATAVAAAPTTTQPTTQSTTAVESEDVAVAFLAAVDVQLAATTYAGQAIEAPDVFLATGRLFCEQLDQGMTADDVLTEYVQELSGGSIDDATDDDLVLAGSVLGAGLATLCPQHAGALGR